MNVFFPHLHVGQGVRRGGPSHERVLPPLPGLELELPPPDSCRAGLHGVLGRAEDAHQALLDVLLGHPRHLGDVGGARDRDGTGAGQVHALLIQDVDLSLFLVEEIRSMFRAVPNSFT